MLCFVNGLSCSLVPHYGITMPAQSLLRFSAVFLSKPTGMVYRTMYLWWCSIQAKGKHYSTVQKRVCTGDSASDKKHVLSGKRDFVPASYYILPNFLRFRFLFL